MSALPWTSAQRRMLEAMGYTLLSAATGAAPGGEAAGVCLRVASELEGRPLFERVLRAAGLERAAARRVPEGETVRYLWSGASATIELPPIELLRQARGKRALWPRLRALKKAQELG